MKKPELSELTLKQKISQLLMVNQITLIYKDDGTLRNDDEIKELMSKYQYGSLWNTGDIKSKNANLAEEVNYGSSTTAQYKAWLNDITGPVDIPLLVGVDCENGTGRIYSDGTDTSAAIAIGAADDEELTYELASSVAREIKASGANWRWSPIVDMNSRFSCSVVRHYADDPDTVIKHASAAIRAANDQKMVSTIKHFPGSDGMNCRDSHIVPTQNNMSLEDWRKTQGKLFKGAIDAGVDSVMIGHTAFPAGDDALANGRYFPATLSEKIINGLLREELGFKGVVITDGLTMTALTSFCEYDEMLIRLINAGNDILLGVNPTDYDIVEKAVLDGRILMSRIDESAERVLALKEKIGLFSDEPEEEIDMTVQPSITAAVDKKIAEKSITLVRDMKNLIPVKKEDIKNVAIVCCSHYSGTERELEVMKKEFEARGAKVTMMGDIDDKLIVKKLAEENDLIIYAAYVSSHRPMGLPSLYGPKMETFFNAFSFGKDKSIGVSMGYPYLCYDAMGGSDVLINTYSTNPEALKAFVKVVYGEIKPTTNSPVDLESKPRFVYC